MLPEDDILTDTNTSLLMSSSVFKLFFLHTTSHALVHGTDPLQATFKLIQRQRLKRAPEGGECSRKETGDHTPLGLLVARRGDGAITGKRVLCVALALVLGGVM